MLAVGLLLTAFGALVEHLTRERVTPVPVSPLTLTLEEPSLLQDESAERPLRAEGRRDPASLSPDQMKSPAKTHATRSSHLARPATT